jgi:hypothetical protein
MRKLAVIVAPAVFQRLSMTALALAGPTTGAGWFHAHDVSRSPAKKGKPASFSFIHENGDEASPSITQAG